MNADLDLPMKKKTDQNHAKLLRSISKDQSSKKVSIAALAELELCDQNLMPMAKKTMTRFEQYLA